MYYVLMYLHTTVKEHPNDTTTCQNDNANFTCVVFQPIGSATPPGWLRDGVGLDIMRHSISSNVTRGSATPVYISSTVIVYNVTVFDNGTLYQCDVAGLLTSDGGTLYVVGKYLYTCMYCMYLRMYVHT